MNFHQHNDVAYKAESEFYVGAKCVQVTVWFPDVCDKPAAMWLRHTSKRISFKFPGPLFIGRLTL